MKPPCATRQSAPAPGSRRGHWSKANDKNFARIKILKTLCQQIEAAMQHK